jgi:hypothetical protein
VKKKMLSDGSNGKAVDQAASPGTTDRSSDRFDQATAAVPGEIGGEPIEGEVIPPGQESKAEPDTGWPVYDLKLIGGLPFFILARRYGDLWELDDKELDTLARAWKPMLDRYLPLENTEWGTALLVSLAIVGPRAQMTDWKKGKKPNSTPPGNTRTAASGESSATSGNVSQEKPPEWDLLRDE